MIPPSLIKKSIFTGSLLLLSILSIFFIDGYRLSFQKNVSIEKRGVLVLSGTEKNVVVRIDANFVRTDLPYVSTSVPLGNHSIEVLKAGYISYQEKVYVDDVHANMHYINLEPEASTHTVISYENHPGKMLLVLDHQHIGEFYAREKKLFIYDSFAGFQSHTPSRTVSLSQIPSNLTVEGIDLFNDGYFFVHTKEANLLLSEKDQTSTPVLLPKNISLASTFTDTHNQDPRSILFNSQKAGLNKLFQTKISELLLPENQPQTYVVTSTDILSCEYLLPDSCTSLIQLTSPIHRVVYWEKEHAFVLENSKTGNPLTVIQTRKVTQGSFILPS